MAKQVDKIYGDALFELSLDENIVDDLYNEVNEFINILCDNDELIKLLGHPQINKEERLKIVDDTFAGRISDSLMGLIGTVVEKGHIDKLIDILKYFVKQVKNHKNIGEATVTSAILLSDEQKKSIEKRLIETTSYNEMEIEYLIDKSLIGGLVIRIEDRVVDSSIKTKLEQLSRTLANA